MLTQEQYKQKLNELIELKNKVVLDSDPVAGGLQSFNKKLSELELCRESTASKMMEANWNRSEYEQAHSEAKARYEDKVNKCLQAEEVKSLRSADLRLAYVNTVVLDELNALRESEKDLAFAKAYYNNARIVEEILDAKNTNLIKQIDQIKILIYLDPNLRDELKKGLAF